MINLVRLTNLKIRSFNLSENLIKFQNSTIDLPSNWFNKFFVKSSLQYIFHEFLYWGLYFEIALFVFVWLFFLHF